MKLRQPKTPPPADNDSQHFTLLRNPKIWVGDFQATTLTPIYGGGVKAGEPDAEMPVRAAALRGQLRYWWRLLKHHHPEKPLQGEALFREERAIWGGMSEGEADHASKVRVKVSELERDTLITQDCAKYDLDNKNNKKYKTTPSFRPDVHPYALFPGQGQLSRDRRQIEKHPAKIILAGLKFKLRIECPVELQLEILETLRWWANFGGIGARTRRGLGAVYVEGLHSAIPEVSQYGCKLVKKASMPNAIEAWKKAIDSLQSFRQGQNVGRNVGEQTNRPGRSRWPEPGSIRAITGRYRIKADGVINFQPAHPDRQEFPRAAFGLPIIFHFQNDTSQDHRDRSFDPEDCELKALHSDRMASPVILKPMAMPDGKFAPIALRLPIGHLENLELQLRNSGSQARNPHLPRNLHRDDWWPLDPARQRVLANESIRPLRDYPSDEEAGEGIDALAAFLNYFKR